MSTATPVIPIAAGFAARLRPPAGLGALARLEARRLLRHPALLAGAALSLLGLRDVGDGATLDAYTSGFALLPVAAGTLVAANLAALRSRRHGTDELYGTLPRPRAMRVAALLLALLSTLPLSCALVAAGFVAEAMDGHPSGFTPPLIDIAQGPAMVVAFGALGVLLARIAPSPIAAPLVIVALFASRIVVVTADSWVAWLLPMAGGTASIGPSPPCEPAAGDCLAVFDYGMLWAPAHLIYLVGFALLAGGASLLPARPRIRFAALAAAAAGLAIATKLVGG